MITPAWTFILFFVIEWSQDVSGLPEFVIDNPDYTIKRGRFVDQVTTAILNLHQAITNMDAANITSIVKERRISPVV